MLHVPDRGIRNAFHSRAPFHVLDSDRALYNTYHDDDRLVGILANGAMNEHYAVYCVLNEAVLKLNLLKLLLRNYYKLMIHTRVGLALSLGKLIFVDCSFSVDGLFGVGGSRLP